jgi:hypothetical protein
MTMMASQSGTAAAPAYTFVGLTVSNRCMFSVQNAASNAVLTNVPASGSDCIAGSPQHEESPATQPALYGGWSAPDCEDGVNNVVTLT